MASDSEQALQAAISAVEQAFARLDGAAEMARLARGQSAAERETLQAELTDSWQRHSAGLETQLADAQGENEFLKADNLRLSNQLQQLQRDYLALQEEAGHAVGRLDATVKQLDLILEH